MVRLIIYILAGSAIIYIAATRLATLPLPEINPDSKIYFFDNLVEKFKLLSLREPDEKIDKLLEYSDEKLDEIKYVINSESKEKSKLLEKVLPKHEKYIEEAIEEVGKIKWGEEGNGNDEKKNESASSSVSSSSSGSSSGSSASSGSSSGSLAASRESEISSKVLEKKEVLNEIFSELSDEPEEEKEIIREIIEREIIKTETIIEKIIEQVEGPIKEVIIYKTERTDEAIEDKKEEEEMQQEQENKEALSGAEKLYYIWIDSLYSKTLPNANEPFFMRAHIRRRDDECKFFNGKIILKINGGEWQSEISQMQPSDDLWRDLGPVELSAGSYAVDGKLIDKSNRIISTKQFEMMVD